MYFLIKQIIFLDTNEKENECKNKPSNFNKYLRDYFALQKN